MLSIKDMFADLQKKGVSDIFLTAGKRVSYRLNGEICRDEASDILSPEEINNFRLSLLDEPRELIYQESGNIDSSWATSNLDRYRLNFLNSIDGPMVIARPIGVGETLDFDKLNLPEALTKFCKLARGLVLISGATGTGKSTTQGSIINYINQNYSRHIITIEDPIEFIHPDKKSLITQREINSDVIGFAEALRHAMRENPDVIVIGEMRDTITAKVAINAALTGHLVFATVHADGVTQTIDRILNLFPKIEQNSIALDLASAIEGIISQRLLPRITGGVIPALEILEGTSSVRNAIAEMRINDIDDLLRENIYNGMQTFNRAIYQLFSGQSITIDSALKAVNNPDEFMLQLRGMERGVDSFRNVYGSGKTKDNSDIIDMQNLLRTAVRHKASDLILTVGTTPILRINGDLQMLDLPALQMNDTSRLLLSLLSPTQRVDFEKNRELDIAISVNFKDLHEGDSATYRFRVNGFYQRGCVGIVARVVSNKIPQPQELNIPSVLFDIIKKQQGLVLVTGPTGSGKSTTLASLINHINHNRQAHIITIEDPIEYVYENAQSIIEQRELHADTLTFSSALRHALRQDPDIILLGEMRDIETISAALTAAETGHLVFATLHTNSAALSIDRIIDSFPAQQQNQIRQQLAGSLLCIASQRLLNCQKENRRVAAFEILLSSPAIQALIRDSKIHLLTSTMEIGGREGMITMSKALNNLVASGVVSEDEANQYRNISVQGQN